MVEVVVNPRVVRVVVQGEDMAFDQWYHTLSSELFAESHIAITLVSDH
jgi:hypothetical protein